MTLVAIVATARCSRVPPFARCRPERARSLERAHDLSGPARGDYAALLFFTVNILATAFCTGVQGTEQSKTVVSDPGSAGLGELLCEMWQHGRLRELDVRPGRESVLAKRQAGARRRWGLFVGKARHGAGLRLWYQARVYADSGPSGRSIKRSACRRRAHIRTCEPARLAREEGVVVRQSAVPSLATPLATSSYNHECMLGPRPRPARARPHKK
jgi:hypothetical protein